MRPVRFVPLLCAFLVPGCDDGTSPRPDPEPTVETGVDVLLDATVERSDTALVVNGARLFEYPSIDRSVWVYRYLHFDFGGFPELGYPQSARVGEFRGLHLTHQTAEITRNDSTIWSYADHGDVTIEGVELDRLDDIPVVTPGDPIGFENYVRYSVTSFGRVTWLDGETTYFEELPFHQDLAAGETMQLASTGSAAFEPASWSFAAASMATLVHVENGDTIALERDQPPTLNTDTTLVLEFDEPLDPARAYIIFSPFFGAHGARSAFLMPEEPARRVVIPASLLGDLIADAVDETVPYRIFIEEFASAQDAFTGTDASGAPFSLGFGQESETALAVWLAR